MLPRRSPSHNDSVRVAEFQPIHEGWMDALACSCRYGRVWLSDQPTPRVKSEREMEHLTGEVGERRLSLSLGQPADAWTALTKVDGIQPKMPVPESTRIEFINLQAGTAATLGNLELSRTYLQAGVDAATVAVHDLWVEEAFGVYQHMQTIWPGESQVQSLSGLFEKQMHLA